MSKFAKFVLLLCIPLLFCLDGRAHVIDSLFTKDAVQKFLVDSFKNAEVIFAPEYADITRMKKIELLVSKNDSILVTDPITGQTLVVALPPDTTFLDNSDTLASKVVHPLDHVFENMDSSAYYFYKADIDGNGYTDLVVDAGPILIVMNLGNKFKCYLFAVFSEISFQSFLSFGDKSVGILFKHHHYPCERSYANDTLAVLCRRTDTLVYRLNEFAAYNSNPKPLKIAKVFYQYVHSAGIHDRSACLEINNDGRCFLKYSQDDTLLSAILDNKKVNELWNFIAYADLKSKKNNYYTSINHAEGGVLTVHFDDGTVKKIISWACAPPWSVCGVSRLISNIEKDLPWQPSQAGHNLDCPIILLTDSEDFDDNNNGCCSSY